MLHLVGNTLQYIYDVRALERQVKKSLHILEILLNFSKFQISSHQEISVTLI